MGRIRQPPPRRDSPPAGREFQRAFFAARPELLSVVSLFEAIPGVCFYAKDADSRFVRLNRANAAIYGQGDEGPLLGKSDRDFHPPHLAEAYIAEDRRVMRVGAPILNQTWLVPFLHGPVQWFVSSKTPLVGADGRCVGVAGVMRPIATPRDELERFQRLAPAVRALEERFRETVSVEELGALCGLSATHVHRLFRKLLRISPAEYQLSLRMQEARTLLATTDEPLSGVALRTGFFDQSHFTKRFRQATGMTPSRFRRSFGRDERRE